MEEAQDTTDLKADLLGLAGNYDAGGKRVVGTETWRPQVLTMDIVRDRGDNAPVRESPCRDENISVHCVATTTTATTAAVEKKSLANGDLDPRQLKRARVRDNVLIQVYNNSRRHRHTDLRSSLSNLQRSLHGFSVVSRRVASVLPIL